MPNKLPAANVPGSLLSKAEGQRLQGAASAGSFSWKMARLLLQYSARAYESPSPVFGPDFTITDQNTDATALIFERFTVPEGCLVIAFKGSSKPEDFIQDAKARQKNELLWTLSDAVAKVHTGFLEDFEAIAVQLVSAVRATLFAKGKTFMSGAGAPPYQPKVFITGHSLGGALAILCALEFKRQGIPVAAVYTFGQPRVGNNIFAHLYDLSLRDRTYRIVNQNDIVPRLPGWLMGYRHCGQEVFLPVDGGWALNPALWAVAMSDAIGLYGAYRHREDVLIREHFLDAYQTRIASLTDTGNSMP